MRGSTDSGGEVVQLEVAVIAQVEEGGGYGGGDNYDSVGGFGRDDDGGGCEVDVHICVDVVGGDYITCPLEVHVDGDNGNKDDNSKRKIYNNYDAITDDDDDNR